MEMGEVGVGRVHQERRRGHSLERYFSRFMVANVRPLLDHVLHSRAPLRISLPVGPRCIAVSGNF
jgi:hypothetical protein